jgi:two-component system response regulator GlrR
MNTARILVVDDDLDLLHLISVRLCAAGYEVIESTSGEEALVVFREQRPQLVISDLRMGEMDGLALFAILQVEAPTVPVIILTAHGSIPDAVSASQRGVFSFLTKPFDGHELLRRVSDAIRVSPALDPAHDTAQWRQNMLTASVRMDDVLRQALRISTEDRCALIIGANGTGKATLVQAMHQAGKRSSSPLVTLACTDHPATELEVALQLGAVDSVFCQADGGVLHIRDVGALSPVAQSRLFAALFEQKQARDPLHSLYGTSSGSCPLDVQVIASSPRPLDAAVAECEFRSDLFYLLGGATLQLPPLCERPEDIPTLATHFLSRMSSEIRITLTPDALFALQKARWPGNVRQLRNVLEQVASLTLTPSIPEALVSRVIRECDEESLQAFDDARRAFERDYLVRLLQTTVGNVSRAARVAQRNRTEFYKLLARHGLDPANFKQKFP